ncbi:MAG: tRNA (adenosine(37)-N6)-threonylcarbamoyltransferase complex transferase subunit TsaD [Oscillospiraceae bacterium]|jgi:N6-L-threonylcarbamoyladenine synthase|nr:tRNA (adenosine(37)-N6)-threonylcarbamoyltransferase complex transferase subunit TsaD [Oscillospiraceae bacterium]
MNILAFESSCDETAAAVVRDGREILSNEIYSQADKFAIYGGVVPEIASRNHLAVISRLADLAIKNAGLTRSGIDAVAVTNAPGLIGALLVGLSFAKGAALALGVPLVPVHHLRGHIAANYLAFPELAPPFTAVVVSGGNTIIADVRGHTDIEIVGSTRDDAAGECFDKAARVLGLPYPGGRLLDELAQSGDEAAFRLPRPSVMGAAHDMSFSGLKTAVVNIVHNAEQKGETVNKADLAASFSAAVSDILVPRVIAAARESGYGVIVAAGGVAANSRVRRDLARACGEEGIRLCLPPLTLCGDNAAMIACQGYYELLAGNVAAMDLNAYATMELQRTPASFGAGVNAL